MIILRDYQREAVDAQLSYWANGGGHSLIVLPTGSGKTACAAELIRTLHQEYGARIVLASHVSELIAQNASTLARHWPSAPLGIYHSGLKRKDASAPIVFAGIHSIYKNPEALGERHVLIVDEVHLVPHRSTGMYRKLIEKLSAVTPNLRVCGLTATAYRLQSGRLDEDYGEHKALFSDIVYEVPILRLIKDGYLCPILPYVSPEKFDLTGVRTSAGEYNQKDLQAAVDKDDLNARVANEIVNAGRDRRTWLVFASGVSHAEHLTKLLQEREIVARCIHGETPEAERREIFDATRSGEIRALCGVSTLTTGVDIPSVDLIACVRPSKSKGLWTQILGRGTRLSPETGKQNCLLLDFTQNSLTFGPLDMLDGSKQPGGNKGMAPVRECPQCHFIHHISLLACPQCANAYPAHEPKYTSQSKTSAIFSTQQEPEWYDLESVIFRRHQKEGKPDSFRIDYTTKFMTIPHWLALGSESGKAMARGWWSKHSYSGSPPDSVDEALTRTDDIRVPGRIQVIKEGKLRRIVSWDYTIPPGKIVPTMRQFSHGKFFRPKVRA